MVSFGRFGSPMQQALQLAALCYTTGWQRYDRLKLVGPGQPHQTRLASAGFCPDRRNIAALTEGPVQTVIEMALANGRIRRIANGGHSNTVAA